jgi:hypothetical protein
MQGSGEILKGQRKLDAAKRLLAEAVMRLPIFWHFSDLPTPLTNVGQVKSGSNSDIARSTRL